MPNALVTAAPDTESVRELAAELPGRVALPGDPGWEELRLGWIRNVDQQPSAVVNVADEKDVEAAVKWAAHRGFTVSAQVGGHGATTALNGTIVIRTRALSGITVDTERGTARVGAGVKWGELLAATSELGLTGLAGSTGDTSVVGLTLGGGMSWFGRAYGLAAHSVLAVELVDAGGQLRRITPGSDPTLFWALCGGGGDFGIVTAMEISLHPAPHVYGGRLMWPVAMAWPALAAFLEVTRQAPEELTLWAQLIRFPSLPEIPEAWRGGSFVSIDCAFLGSAAEAEALLAPFREIPARMLDTMGTVKLANLDGIVAEPVDPMPILESSRLLTDLDNRDITALLEAVRDSSGLTIDIVQIRHLGGAFARASAADGPAGAITEPYQLMGLGVPFSPEMTQQARQTLAAMRAAVSDRISGRTMFTFLGMDDDPSRAFSPWALGQLRLVKESVDPTGLFRSNRPVMGRPQ